jgi:hypothetical protein
MPVRAKARPRLVRRTPPRRAPAHPKWGGGRDCARVDDPLIPFKGPAASDGNEKALQIVRLAQRVHYVWRLTIRRVGLLMQIPTG